MIRSPAGYGGEDRIKRYLDYYQPSYGAMMLAEGLFGFSTPAGVLLGAETSGMAIDFTSAPTSTLVRTANSLSTNYYSGLPFQNEGNGPVTFSRASNATVTDSDGKVKWAGHNLLTNSESFGATAWTKASVTVSANSTSAPNGTTTADKVVSTSGTGEQRIYIGSVVPSTVGIRYTFPVFAKADGANWLVIRDALSGFGDTSFDLVNGAVGTVASGRTATITSVGNGFYLCSVSNTVTASYVVGDISYCLADVDNGRATFVGNGTKALILWGAHLYRSDLGGMVLNPARGDAYYPTTPRNLLGFTESLTTGWTNSNTTDSIVTETNPNGLASSVEVTATAGNGTLLGSLSLLASPYTFSIWLKRKTGTGTVEITVDGTTYVAAAVTGTWTRFSTTLTPTAGTKTPGIRLVTSGDAVFAWGAQLSDSASLDAYSPVYGAAVTSAAYYAPRLDYDANGSALGLLVEEQRTNIATHSSEFDNSTFWPRADVDVTANATAAPDGTTTADKLIASATTANHLLNRTNFITVTNGLSYTHSIYAKASEYAFIRVQFQASGFLETWANFNLTTGAVGLTNGSVTTSIRAVGNGWYRCSVSATATANGNSGMQLFVLDSDRGGSSPSYLGNGTSGIFIWGAQVETSASFPTSFIPTIGNTTATRTADVASVSTQAFPYSGTEGTLVISTGVINDAVYPTVGSLSDTTANNVILLQGSSTGANMQLYVVSGGSVVVNTSAQVFSLTSAKTAAAYKLNDYAYSTQGAAPTADTSATVPTMNTLHFGSERGVANWLNGYIRQTTYIPRRLSNAELQSRSV